MPEKLLRKLRPVGPTAGLRGRILRDDHRAWPWAVAAAALLVITVALHGATRSMTAGDLGPRPVPFGPDVRVSYIAHALGGGEEAVHAATLIVMEEETRGALPPVAGATVPNEASQ